MDRYLIQSSAKTLEVLLAFAKHPHRFSLNELVEITQMDKNQVFRSVRTLEHVGFVRTDSAGRYGLTPLVGSLAKASYQSIPISLTRAAAPVMEDLARLSGETVALFSVDDERAVCVDILDSPSTVRWSTFVGQTVYLHAGAAPKAALAFLAKTQQERLLAKLDQLPAYTPYTFRDPKALRRELSRIRSRGYSIADRDFDIESRAVGAPIFGANCEVVGGLSIGAPAYRLDETRAAFFGQELILAANAISLVMGCASSPLLPAQRNNPNPQ